MNWASNDFFNQNFQPLVHPIFITNDFEQGPVSQNSGQFLGPGNNPNNENKDIENAEMDGTETNQAPMNRIREEDKKNDNRRDRDRGCPQGNRVRRRSRSRERFDNKTDNRNRGRNRERRSKWDNEPIGLHVQPGMPRMNTFNEGGHSMGLLNMPGQNMVGASMPVSNMEQNVVGPNMQIPMHPMGPGQMAGAGFIPGQMPSPMPGHIMQPGQDAMQGPGNPMMPGIMPFGNNILMSQIEMMQNMQMMGMNPNMMMNQQMMLPNQTIFVNHIVLLPPLPGSSLPPKREKPKGCHTIVIGGLPNEIQQNDIAEIFSRFGEIKNIVKHPQGICQIRFEKAESVENAFTLSGYRFKYQEQMDAEASTLFVDYALSREDQTEYHNKTREPSPPKIEPYTPSYMAVITEKIKSETEFSEAAPTLAGWLEKGACNRTNANQFYSLIQVTNNQVRRLLSEKMTLDEEYVNLKTILREKFAKIVMQLEQVAKIMTAARHQRAYDHFSKQQRRNIDMWLKMSEEVQNIKEEFNNNFSEDEIEKIGKNVVAQDKYDELVAENEKLIIQIEGYRNEAHLAKEEGERKFEKFKAQFIAQQALQNAQLQPRALFPPLSAPQTKETGDEKHGFTVSQVEAKLISIISTFLLVHPLGATSECVASYVQSMTPSVSQDRVDQVLNKYTSVFFKKVNGVGAKVEHLWFYIIFDNIKKECKQNLC